MTSTSFGTKLLRDGTVASEANESFTAPHRTSWVLPPSLGVRRSALKPRCRLQLLGTSWVRKGLWGGSHHFAQELHLSTALSQGLPELQGSQAYAWPCTSLVQNLTHRLDFLAGSQALLITRDGCPGAAGWWLSLATLPASAALLVQVLRDSALAALWLYVKPSFNRFSCSLWTAKYSQLHSGNSAQALRVWF